jgi:RNA polymerase sigma-70 factor, ECF subfamily
LIVFFPFLFASIDARGDRDLALRLQQRDPDALAETYDKYGRIAFAVILRIVRDAAIAEDLTQETFLRVWNRAAGFDAERGALGPWILTVARNRAIDYIRSTANRARKSAVEISATEMPASFVDLEAGLIDSDRARQLKAAFDRLNERQRQVIELAYFEGLSQSEMADFLGQPLGTVKTWVRTALQVLRAELEQAIPA